jgi:endonuclease YncB( thermonuclease family)
MWERLAGALCAAIAMATGAALLAGAVEGESKRSPKAVGVVVDRVDSGDTLTLLNGTVLRLANIDAPQMTRDDCFATPARDQLRALVTPGTVIGVRGAGLPQRPGEPAKVYVFNRAKNINLTLVKRGAAGTWLMGGRRDRYTTELVQAARRAKQARNGLWSACAGTAFAVERPLRTVRPRGMWVSLPKIRHLPTSGAAWTQLNAAADGDFGRPDVADRNSEHDVLTLAAALVFARTRQASYRDKVVRAIDGAISSDRPVRLGALARARNVVPYVVAADLVDLHAAAPSTDARFRHWLRGLRKREFKDGNIVSNHETRPNNHGTMAGAARVAIAVYLHDAEDVSRAADVFRGWVGDARFPTQFTFTHSLSWQADPLRPVAVDPPGARKEGQSLDGALPEEMRRGCKLQARPCLTGYPWEALQGAVVQAQLLHNAGYDAFRWGSDALRRAVRYLYRLSLHDPRWLSEARADDGGVAQIVNAVYGTHFPTGGPPTPGKNMAWTAWTHGK